MEKQKIADNFLNFIASIYTQNPNIPIEKDTIYYYLANLNFYDKSLAKLPHINLVGVQTKLNSNFKNNPKVHTFLAKQGYFWVIENRNGLKDDDYMNYMKEAIKLYIPAQAEELYYLTTNIVDFMLQENIIMQTKLAKEMRNDALIIRVKDQKDAKKIKDYLTRTLNYHPRIRPNPFVPQDDNLNFAKDGILSYNKTLSKLITEYLISKSITKSLSKVNQNDFINFVQKELDEILKSKVNSIKQKYNIQNDKEYNDFIEICQIIIQSETITLDEINTDKLSQSNIIKTYEVTEEAKETIVNIIYYMSFYYSIDETHKRIMRYINTGDKNILTRRDNIRMTISENFPPKYLKEIILELGWESLLSAAFETIKVHGERQLEYAFNLFINKGEIIGFTNQNNVRSRLGMLIPKELLYQVIISKLAENNLTLTPENITGIVKEELQQNKKNQTILV